MELGYKINRGMVHCSDVFYKEKDEFKKLVAEYNCLCVEMETFALFHNAMITGKRATAILTISDSLVTHKETTSDERQNNFSEMVKIALEASLEL